MLFLLFAIAQPLPPAQPPASGEPLQILTPAPPTPSAGTPGWRSGFPQTDTTCSRDDSGVPALRGGPRSERVWGSDMNSRLFGGAGQDFLAGGPGDDEVVGGPDLDILVGGAGSDRFVIDSADDSAADESGSWSQLNGDTIVDLTPKDFDKIDLRGMRKEGANVPATFLFTGRRPGNYAVWSRPRSGDTEVLVDVDGDSKADVALRLIGNFSLTPALFCGVGEGAVTEPSE